MGIDVEMHCIYWDSPLTLPGQSCNMVAEKPEFFANSNR